MFVSSELFSKYVDCVDVNGRDNKNIGKKKKKWKMENGKAAQKPMRQTVCREIDPYRHGESTKIQHFITIYGIDSWAMRIRTVVLGSTLDERSKKRI